MENKWSEKSKLRDKIIDSAETLHHATVLWEYSKKTPISKEEYKKLYDEVEQNKNLIASGSWDYITPEAYGDS